MYCKNHTNHIHFVGKQSFIMLQQVVPIQTIVLKRLNNDETLCF